MTNFDFDYFVIGAGSGGVRSARVAAGHGARVGIAEERALGGTCVNVGCVPKKLLTYAAHFSHDFEDAGGFGWAPVSSVHDWAALIAAKNREIERLKGVYGQLLKDSGVTLFESRAVLQDTHTLDVGGRVVTAEKILIATGGMPVKPDHPGAEYGITSNEAFYLSALPRRVVIVGGGYIAAEFAGIFKGLGAHVTLLYRGDLFLRGFDRDIRLALAEEMKKQKVDLRFNADIVKVEKADSAFAVNLTTGDILETDLVMYATGRIPLTEGLGLENAGIALDSTGAVIVNEDYQTSVKNIYAVGDVTNRLNLTPVAIAEGHVLADTLFGNQPPRPLSYEHIPSAVFSSPPIATVGLTEESARKKYGTVTVFESRFTPMKHTLSGRNEKTCMKVIVDPSTDRVVGVHMMGADAPEIVQGLAVAMKSGATKADFDATIGIHPTAAEEFVTMKRPRG